jgi:transcriptional regulator with XRE-family HTH domain
MRITFNPAALSGAAAEAGDTMRSGRINYQRIAHRAGLDRAVVSRVHRGVNPPDLLTTLALALAYELTVEQLVSVHRDLTAAA